MFKSKRRIDTAKDTQFTDAWIVVSIILTVIGVVLDITFLTTAAIVLLIIIGVSWAWSALIFFGVGYQRKFSETRAFRGETLRPDAGGPEPEISAPHMAEHSRQFSLCIATR